MTGKKDEKSERSEKDEREKNVIKKLKDLGKKVLDEIENNNPPVIEFKSRSIDNINYDEKSKYLILGDKTEKRTFLSVSQAKKFMQTLAIAAK
ncbi:MAG: DNA topoisomerase VI, partial [Candidatus Micrarchaeia archaeon]